MRITEEAFPELRSEESLYPNVIYVPGGTFGMGSDRHYPEDALAHPFGADK
jgi:formylglycine-generating enzyme required for sulfatase activity